MSDPISSTFGRGTLALIAAPVLALVAFAFGPVIEAAVNPVIADHKVAYRVVDGEVVLVTTGRKRRRCLAVRRRSEWTGAGLNEGRLVWEISPNRVAGRGRFDLRNRADVPPRARLPLTVSTTMLYRCHRFWLTPYRYPTASVGPTATVDAPHDRAG